MKIRREMRDKTRSLTTVSRVDASAASASFSNRDSDECETKITFSRRRRQARDAQRRAEEETTQTRRRRVTHSRRRPHPGRPRTRSSTKALAIDCVVAHRYEVLTCFNNQSACHYALVVVTYILYVAKRVRCFRETTRTFVVGRAPPWLCRAPL